MGHSLRKLYKNTGFLWLAFSHIRTKVVSYFSKKIVDDLQGPKGPFIKFVRKIFRKTSISNPMIRTRTKSVSYFLKKNRITNDWQGPKGPSIKCVRKIFQKTFITPWYAQVVRNISFSENFAYVLDGWHLITMHCHVLLFFQTNLNILDTQRQSSRGVLALQLLWNRTSAWVFPVNLLHIFRTPFYKNISGRLLLVTGFKNGHSKNF